MGLAQFAFRLDQVAFGWQLSICAAVAYRILSKRLSFLTRRRLLPLSPMHVFRALKTSLTGYEQYRRNQVSPVILCQLRSSQVAHPKCRELLASRDRTNTSRKQPL